MKVPAKRVLFRAANYLRNNSGPQGPTRPFQRICNAGKIVFSFGGESALKIDRIPRMDHDRLFKQLLTLFFAEFVELFLPEVSAYLARETIEFMDKEIFTDLAAGERHEVDLLVKARFNESDAFFLIHVENLASAQEAFAKRMFRYFARLHENYDLPIYPVALLSYDSPLRPEPDQYQIRFPDRMVLDFSFRVIQLNRLNWRDYLRQPNPVAAALMAKMQIPPEDRPKVKLEFLRMLATLRLDKARSALLREFMTSYLRLTSEENARYNLEYERLDPAEKRFIVEAIDEWDAAGIAKGMKQGVRQGMAKGAVRQLTHRFAPIPAPLSARIEGLPEPMLDEFLIAILDFRNLQDAEDWLDQHPTAP
jgi:hypothetical protein